MSSIEFLWLLLGMMIVTFIPRFIPVLFAGKINLPKKVEKFLKLIPYTAMVSLVFPACFNVDDTYPWIGLSGVGVAAVLAYFRVPTIICVIFGIVTDLIIYLCLGVY